MRNKAKERKAKEKKKSQVRSQLTLIVPTVFGCSRQKWGNSPASVKVKSNVAAGASILESNLPSGVGGVAPDMTVCSCESSFVHVTVAPTLT